MIGDIILIGGMEMRMHLMKYQDTVWDETKKGKKNEVVRQK